VEKSTRTLFFFKLRRMSSSNERGPNRGNGLTMAPLSKSVVLANFPNWRSFANTLGLLTHPVICLCFVPFNKGHTYRFKITKVKLLLIHWNMKYLFKGKQRPFIKRLKASLVSYHISASITSQAALVSIWSLDQGLSEQSLKISLLLIYDMKTDWTLRHFDFRPRSSDLEWICTTILINSSIFRNL